MSREVVSVDATAPIGWVRECLAQGGFHHLPVLDGGCLVGVISLTDLWRVGGVGNDPRVTARNIMRERPITVRRTTTLLEAARLLEDGDLHSLPVVDARNQLEGILTSTDLIRVLIGMLE